MPASGFWIALTGSAGNDSIYGYGAYWNVADYGTSSRGIRADLAAASVSDGLGGTDSLVDVVNLRALSAADTLIGGDGGAWIMLEGMAGNDTIAGKGLVSNGVSYVSSPTGVTINLGASTANDGWGGTDRLDGVVRVIGSAYADSLKGGTADDWFQASWGDDTVNGAGGSNTLDYGTIAGPVQVTLTGNGAGTVLKPHGSDSFSSITAVQGGAGADTLTGSAAATAAVYLRGMEGNDVIQGAGNRNNVADYSDRSAPLVFDLQQGKVIGAADADVWVDVAGVRGTAWDDTFKGGADHSVFVDGGGGLDTLDYSALTQPITLIVDGSTAAGGLSGTVIKPNGIDTFTAIDRIIGTDGEDDLSGSPSAVGASTVRLVGGKGDDVIDGAGSALNRIDYTDSPNGITVNLQVFGDSDVWFGFASDGWGSSDILISVVALYGSAASDTIHGSAQEDLLLGGAGDDILDGGLGHDTALYWYDKAQVSWARNPGGSWTVTTPDGTDVLRDIEALQFNDGKVNLLAVQDDFDGNGLSDILFENSSLSWMGTSYRAVAQWSFNGTTFLGGGNFGMPEASWSVVSTGDFNGDGRADVLWRNVDGKLSIWQMNGLQYLDGNTIGTVPSAAETEVLGTGDFDGDGKSDILLADPWPDANGVMQRALHLWHMDGLTLLGDQTVASVPMGSTVQAIADFDGDGRADILLRNADNIVALWRMDGLGVLSGASLSYVSPDWSVAGSGDFNGDGRADILWRHADGSVALWLMDGTKLLRGATLWNPGTDWKVAGVGDYNGDAKSDILWQQDVPANRTHYPLAVWLMDGLAVIGGGTIGYPEKDWQVV